MIYDFSKLVKIGNKILYKNNGLVVQMKNGDTPVPPEPTDPIEEYQVTGLTVDYSAGSSSSETYDISWDPCREEWFDETCNYEVSVKQGETLIDSVEMSYDSEVAQFDPYSYIDDTEYTFDVRVVKGNKKSLPSTETVTYRDSFHDETINFYDLELYIPTYDEAEGYTNGYIFKWENNFAVDHYELYLDNELYAENIKSFGNDVSQTIENKDPGTYDLEIKAYNHKNTMISISDSLILNDPMDNVVISTLQSDEITYNSESDTISLNTTPTISYNEDSLPEYLENRLNGNNSLEIYIDNDLVRTQNYALNIEDIDVSELSEGTHSLSFKLVTSYNGYVESDSTEFEISKADLCQLDNNNFTINGDYDVSGDTINLEINFENEIDFDKEYQFSIKINGQDFDYYNPSTKTNLLVIWWSDFENYGIYRGQDNEITVTISCEEGHGTEISNTINVYVPEL